mgnify:CR=1 FL=1
MSTNNDMFGIVSRPQHSVWVHTGSGRGSSYVTCRRFTVVQEILGDAIEYKEDAAKGSEFWIKKSGLYFVEYRDSYSGGNTSFGITRNCYPELNGNETSTTITGFSSVNGVFKVIAFVQASTSATTATCSTLINLKQGDVLRAQDNTSNDGANIYTSHFKITYIDQF